MMVALIPLITSMPILLWETLSVSVAAVVLYVIHKHMGRRASALKRFVLSVLLVAIVGAVWCMAVDPVGNEWSIAGLVASPDLIGTGTSIQRSLGTVTGGSELIDQLSDVWAALIGSCVVVAGVWTLLTVPKAHARKAPVRRGR